MSHQCLPTESIEPVRVSPPDDARRRDVESCPRCRTLLLSYAEFLDDRSVPAGIDPERAGVLLEQAIEQALAEAADDPPLPAKPASPAARSGRPMRGSARAAGPWWSGWFEPRLAWGAAAAVIVALGLYAGAGWRTPAPGGDVLRATPDQAGTRTPDLPVPFAPRVTAGGLELRWTSTPGADAYRVIFLDENLERLATVGPASDTVAVLAPGHLPAGLRSGQTVAWLVEALQGGYRIVSSETSLVTLP